MDTNGPKYTPLQSGVIRSALDAKLFHTYARLIALAWKHDFKRTDWLTEDDLVDAIGLDWSNVKRHLTQLKQAGLLAWDTDRKNGKRFSILEVRLEEGAKAQDCAPSSSGSYINHISQVDQLLPLAKAQDCALDTPEGILDPEAFKALRQAGIGETTAIELSNIPTVTVWYIRAMTAKARHDGVSNGALIYRIKEQWGAPDWCEQCGEFDGQHAGDCPTQAKRRAADAITQAAERERSARLPQPPAPAPMSAEMVEAGRVWEQTLGELQLQLPGATFTHWLRRTSAVRRENGTLVVCVPNTFALDMLEHRLRPMIERAVTGVAGQALEVRFVVTEGAWSSDLRTVIEKTGAFLSGDLR